MHCNYNWANFACIKIGVEIMLTERQKNNIRNEVDNWLDTLIFYHEEYGGNKGENLHEISAVFENALREKCLKLRVELRETYEEE